MKAQAKAMAMSMARKMRASIRPQEGPSWLGGGLGSFWGSVTEASVRLPLREWDFARWKGGISAKKYLGLGERIATQISQLCV